MNFKRVIALIGAIIAVVEGLIMMAFGTLPPIESPLIEAALDVSLLTFLSAPFVYLWVMRPMHREHQREVVVKGALEEIMEVTVQPIALTPMLDRVLETVTGLPWVDNTGEQSIFVADELGNLHMTVHRNMSPNRLSVCTTVPCGVCRCGEVAKTQRVQNGPCPESLSECRESAQSRRRHILPLVMAEETVGVASLCLTAGYSLCATEQAFLASLTRTLAEVIERDRTQKRLAHGDTLQAIMDHAPIGICKTDTEGKPRFVNETLCRELGLSSEEMLAADSIGELFDEQVVAEFSLSIGRGIDTDRQRAVYSSVKLPGTGPRDFKVTRVNIRTEQGVICGFVGLVEDITETRRLNDRIAYQASHDALTGLLNRSAFEQKLDRVCQNVDPLDTPHAVCYIDLDEFKIVNDTCGHQAGDDLLRQVTTLYTGQLRKTECVDGPAGHKMEPALARLGGDEFGLLLYNCDPKAAEAVAQRLVDVTKRFRFSFGDQVFNIGCSVGIAEVGADNEGVGEVLKQADAACYLSKDKGRGRVHRYRLDDEDLRQRQGAMNWVPRITQALEEDRFVLVYQTIAPLSEYEEGDRFEVLMRYRDDNGELLPPGAFMPAAERFNLMPRLDRWVIKNTFAELDRYYGPDSDRTLASASINLSGQSLGESDLLEFICECFVESAIHPDQICLEITETAAIGNLSAAQRLISRLRDIGCKFSLDDFGSGLSSFAYLKDLPVDYLKIDGSLVKDIADDKVGRAMVDSINQVGHTLELKTVAEWVEDEAIADVLREIGVDYAQGYHVGRPELFSTLLAAAEKKPV